MTRSLSWIAAACFAALATLPSLAIGGSETSPVGQWLVTTGEARYAVVSCGSAGQLCAKLVWLRADARTDENVALLDHYVVRGAQPVGTGKWAGNVVLNGHSYAGTMQLVSRNFMTLRGCSGLLCQTYEFTRV
ncbi:MAG TPA: DUF2147 domain-containing protein [Devosia sp.]|nr:DUF2147 domain-containing protein [Devosia sp.]